MQSKTDRKKHLSISSKVKASTKYPGSRKEQSAENLLSRTCLTKIGRQWRAFSKCTQSLNFDIYLKSDFSFEEINKCTLAKVRVFDYQQNAMIKGKPDNYMRRNK